MARKKTAKLKGGRLVDSIPRIGKLSALIFFAAIRPLGVDLIQAAGIGVFFCQWLRTLCRVVVPERQVNFHGARRPGTAPQQ